MTPEQLAAMLDDLKGPFAAPRKLITGAVAWEMIKSLLAPERIADGIAGIPIKMAFGMPVHIDPEMPACAWRIVETDGAGAERVIFERDWAPGFTHAYWDAEHRKVYAYNPEPLPLPELKIWEDEGYRWRGRWWWL